LVLFIHISFGKQIFYGDFEQLPVIVEASKIYDNKVNALKEGRCPSSHILNFPTKKYLLATKLEARKEGWGQPKV
jgi:hypothetical protein